MLFRSLATLLVKMGNNENVRARKAMFKDKAGENRIKDAKEFFSYLEDEIKSPEKEDRYYGAVDCFLLEAEELVKEFMEEMEV